MSSHASSSSARSTPNPTSFDEVVWFRRHISIPGDPDTWQPVAKTRDRSAPEPEEEFTRYGSLCWGHAEFLVKSDQTPGREAFLIIYLQIPAKGTETRPDVIRAEQASHNNPPSRAYEELEAWKRLTSLESHVTGRLLGFKEGDQGPLDPIPGGWCFYMLVSKPPGVQLGSDDPRLIGDYWVPQGIFWEFDLQERDLIRARLEAACSLLYHARILHENASLQNLYWDKENQRLYLHGVFMPTGNPYVHTTVPFGTRKFDVYGLAKSPYHCRPFANYN